MDDSGERAGARVSAGTVRDLRLVMEGLEQLWERESAADPSVVVSPSQLRVLRALERSPGLSLRELGEVIGSASSALSRLCARLEAMGFVRRLPSEQSGREIELYLTHHAVSYVLDLREQRERTLASVLESVPPAGAKSLVKGLAALRVTVDARLGEPDDGMGIRSA